MYIKDELTTEMENNVGENKCGFWIGRSTTNQILHSEKHKRKVTNTDYQAGIFDADFAFEISSGKELSGKKSEFLGEGQEMKLRK